MMVIKPEGTNSIIITNKLRSNILGAFNNTVQVVVIDSNGKIYVGGFFTSYQGVTANYIIRLNADGTKDTAFDNSTGFNGGVYSIEIDSNGKIYVGGSFTSYKGVAANGIIRLNADGTKDTAFDNSTGFTIPADTASVYITKIDSNGKIYVGGFFTSYKGVQANYIIRLNADGTKDTAFDNSTGFDAEVNSIEIDSNGKIYVGGNFILYKGVEANSIIRLNPNGTKDTGFDNSTGFDGSVLRLILNSSGKLYVGGIFELYKGVQANSIIRLNADGTKDTAFDNSTAFGNLELVYSLILDTNEKLYVGGSFTTYKGVTANNIIRLNADGTKDTNFDNSIAFDSSVTSLAIDSSGKLYVGGTFSSYKSITAEKIIRLNADGSIDATSIQLQNTQIVTT